MSKAVVALLGLALVATGCRRKPTPARETAATVSSAAAARPPDEPIAGERVDVPGGAFTAGSAPGEPGRRPEIEQRTTVVELGPFRMDRLPYPNDPKALPRTNVTREEADRLCSERGMRLCTELEWERACRGPKSDAFSTGAEWSQRCADDPHHCASAFDVLALGAMREWTSSDVIAEDGTRRASVRGAAPASPPSAHRCAARTPERSDAKSESLGFRCCRGARNAALVTEPRAGQTFIGKTLTAQRLTELLEADPHTERLAKDVRLFRDPDAADTVVSRGPGDRKGFLFTSAPLLWNPVAGAEFLVVTGRSGDDTCFVVVFHVLAGDKYRLASSFIMENEPGPVALAYNGYIRPRLHFSTCWGCPGETGKILYRDPDSVTISQP